MSKIFIGLKKDLFGCFRIKEIRDNDNETGLKEGGGMEMSTTVLHSRCPLLHFEYLPQVPLLLHANPSLIIPGQGTQEDP